MEDDPYVKAQAVTYRIIPHSSTLNSANRNFQRALHDLLSINERDFIEWKTVVTSGSIEFYVTMPVSISRTFYVKFRNHEQWRKSTLEKVPESTAIIIEENVTDTYALRYVRADMFALDYRYNEQQTPIREILGVVHELDDGDRFTITIRQESLTRIKWKQIADYAWETWNRGGMPYRKGFDIVRFGRMLGYGAIHTMHEIHSLVLDVLAGVEAVFFKSDTRRQKLDKPTFKNPERDALLINGDLSTQTKNKRNLPAYKSWIHIEVTSDDPVKRGVLAASISGAYGGMSGDNMLEPVKINVKSRKDVLLDRVMYNVMSADELGKIVQLPTSELQIEYAYLMVVNRRTEIEIPRAFLVDSGILAGTATDRGTTYNVYVSTTNPDRLFYGRAYVGMQGMGKDQAIINYIVEAKRKHGIGAVIPDVINEQNGHRGMADALRDHLPPDDVIDIDLADTNNPVYLGLAGIVHNVKDVRIAADRIAEEITQFLMSDADEERFQTLDYLREAAKATGGDLLGIKYMFTSSPYRRRMVEELGDIFDMDTWVDYDRMTEKNGQMSGRQGQIYGPISRRLGQIVNSEYLRPIFCQQPNPAMDLYRWIDEGKVVIFRFPKEDVISRRVIELLMYWIVLNVFLIKVAQDGKTKSLGTYLVLNEPHQYLSAGLVHFMKRMLSEGRKKRLAPIFAFHNFQQFREYPGFVDILKTGINWHIFRNENVKMYEELMPQLSKTFESAQAAKDATKNYQYIAAWIGDDGVTEAPFIVDALPLVGKRYETMDNRKLTQEHSRKYGRPIAEVLAELKREKDAVRSM